MESRSLIQLLLLIFISGLLLAFQTPRQVRQTTVLYDGSLGTTPDQQGLSYISLFSTAANQRYEDGVTILDTLEVATDQAGYFGPSTFVLDREVGYSVHFTGQLLAEEHDNPHRTGFSLLVVSDDLLGLELAFWEDEVWVQEGGVDALFTHAEGVAFDTTAALSEYELAVLDTGYNLSMDGKTILSGQLRDYTAFEGFPDVYESPNLIFLGDNTRRARAETALAYVAVDSVTLPTSTPRPTATRTARAVPTSSDTPRPTATLVPSRTPTAVPTATALPTPTPQPTRRSFWWWLPWLG